MGKQLAIPEAAWHPGLLGPEPQGSYVSKEAAHYTYQLNQFLYMQLWWAAEAAQPRQYQEPATGSSASKLQGPNAVGRIQHTAFLKTPPMTSAKRDEDEACIGGLRNPAHAVMRIPGHLIVGSQISTLIEQYLNEFPECERMAAAALRQGEVDETAFNVHVDALRRTVATAIVG